MNTIPLAEISWKLLIQPTDTWTIWAVIFAIVAGSIYLEQNYKWAAKISGPVVGLLVAMALSSANIMPTKAPVYDIIENFFVPIAIPLLLFRANLFEIARVTGSALIAFFLATIGTLIGCALAAALFWRLLPGVPVLSGLMAASYIGGGVNFYAVKAVYNSDPNVPTMASALFVADNVIMVGFFVILFTISDSKFFRRRYSHPHSLAADTTDSQTLAAEHWKRKPIALFDMAKALAIAVVIVCAGTKIKGLFVDWLGPPVGAESAKSDPPPKAPGESAATHREAGGASAPTVVTKQFLLMEIVKSLVETNFVWITILSVLAATLFHRQLAQIHGAEELGALLLYLFLVAMGLPADLTLVIQQAPMAFLFCAVIAVCNLGFALAAGKVLRVNLEELLLASNATLGGPGSAVAMSVTKGWSKLVVPGLLIGLCGYMIGTPLGIVVVEMLRRWSQ